MLQKQRLYTDKCLNVYRRVTKDLEVICNRKQIINWLIDLLVREIRADFEPQWGSHTSSSMGIKQMAQPSFWRIYINHNKSGVMSAQTLQVWKIQTIFWITRGLKTAPESSVWPWISALLSLTSWDRLDSFLFTLMFSKRLRWESNRGQMFTRQMSAAQLWILTCDGSMRQNEAWQ